MASTHLLGSERIEYTPPGGAGITFLLAVPLMDLEPMDGKERFEWWSIDKRNRVVVTVGDGVREMIATIRMDNQPGALKKMLRHALEDDVVLTYKRSAGGTAYPLKLVAIIGGSADTIIIHPDRDRGKGFAEYEVTLWLRRVDGGSLDDLF